MLAHIGRTEADLYDQAASTQRVDAVADDDLQMVGIRMIDMAYGMGATYAVNYSEVDVLQFPKQWIEPIMHATAHMLV